MTETDLKPEARSAIAERLASLHARDGSLRAEAVVEDARFPESPCHDWFEWDLGKAAAEYWVERARRLIRAVPYTVTIEDVVITVPFYIRDPNRPDDEQGYTSIAKLLDDRELAKRALGAELARAMGATRRAEAYAEVLGLKTRAGRIIRALESFHAEIVQ